MSRGSVDADGVHSKVRPHALREDLRPVYLMNPAAYPDFDHGGLIQHVLEEMVKPL